MEIVTIVGVAASLCSATSLAPQLIKVIKEKNAESVSLGMLGLLIGNTVLWMWYGFLKEDVIIIASNAISFFITIAMIFFSWRYKNKKPAS